GLRESKKLKHGALSLYVGNEMRAAVEAIRSFDLVLPSGLIIILDKCHFAPTITRGVVSIYRLVDNGYIHTFTNYGISVSKDNVFYFNAIPRDGIYEIDMHNLYPNVSSMYNVSNKRAKHALDSSYLWHCRLGHINKKCMDKLQRDGILQPTHDEFLEKCKSCISGKMARKPFPHKVERAKDLLGLIHTDVCGPFRIVSREGASYFITFTYDFSHYGYVYLMKHKHEVFKTFKVFQYEVENQLGKKIKAIRSDQGGEYLIHEFVNHMKSCGIVSQLTPSYTPQHNGVSDRRNRTLLDMVQSIMNLTTLPKSFWGYALESAARILNMAPTKKVERTPYEIWHGKAPNFSYLRVWGYPKEMMGYYFYYPLENKIFVARNVEFFENNLMVQEASGIPSRRSAKIPQAPYRYGEHKLGDLDEPPNYKAALSDPKSNKWLEAMNTEMQSMKDNQVWYLVDLPPNGRTVGKIKKIGFTQNPEEPCVYLKASGSNVAFLVLYVDDILLMGNNVTMLQEVKSWLCKCFSMKYLGEATYILGIKIIRDRSKRLIALSQSAYLEKTLKKFRMKNSKKGHTPMIEKPDYKKSQGSIMYAVRCTKPDVAFAQNLCSRFQQNPEAKYIAAVEASMEAV
ncbi:retrotransposon protein, putative, ty1-copia subclass, partial [Tanacetum coccineum]